MLPPLSYCPHLTPQLTSAPTLLRALGGSTARVSRPCVRTHSVAGSGKTMVAARHRPLRGGTPVRPPRGGGQATERWNASQATGRVERQSRTRRHCELCWPFWQCSTAPALPPAAGPIVCELAPRTCANSHSASPHAPTRTARLHPHTFPQRDSVPTNPHSEAPHAPIRTARLLPHTFPQRSPTCANSHSAAPDFLPRSCCNASLERPCGRQGKDRLACVRAVSCQD